MSAGGEGARQPVRAPVPAQDGWPLWRRQVAGIFRLELGRNLVSRRAFATYLLAFMPVPLLAFWAYLSGHDHGGEQGEAATIFATLYALYLRVSLFLATLLVFMSAFRSEILERSLHYYFLTPVRREVVVVGKYLAALFATALTFTVSISLIFVLFRLHWGIGALTSYLLRGGGLGHLAAYLGIGLLGCVGYGAVFLLTGLFFRNPIVPAVAIWAWEFINFLLPSLLKKLSVIHYLKSLYPVPLPAGLFAVLAEPTSPWLAVPGLVLFTLLVLALAGWRARRMDLGYGGE